MGGEGLRWRARRRGHHRRWPPRGYPGDYPKGMPIARSRRRSRARRRRARLPRGHRGGRTGGLVTSGGRVLAVTGLGPDVAAGGGAQPLGRASASRFEARYFRRDIALARDRSDARDPERHRAAGPGEGPSARPPRSLTVLPDIEPMPELPEVETIVRDLDGLLEGAGIEEVEVLRPDLIEGEGAAALRRAGCEGRTIRGVSRRAKNIVFDLGRRAAGGEPGDDRAPAGRRRRRSPTPSHPGVRFRLADGRELRYHDVRRFGRLERDAGGRLGRARRRRWGSSRSRTPSPRRALPSWRSARAWR